MVLDWCVCALLGPVNRMSGEVGAMPPWRWRWRHQKVRERHLKIDFKILEARIKSEAVTRAGNLTNNQQQYPAVLFLLHRPAEVSYWFKWEQARATAV